MKTHEMALVSSSDPAPGVRVYEFITVLDEPVTLRATSAVPRDDRYTPSEITLDVRAGLWGDPQQEAAIIQTIESKLGRLRRSGRSLAQDPEEVPAAAPAAAPR